MQRVLACVPSAHRGRDAAVGRNMVTNDERTKTTWDETPRSLRLVSGERGTVRCIASEDMSDVGISGIEMYDMCVDTGNSC